MVGGGGVCRYTRGGGSFTLDFGQGGIEKSTFLYYPRGLV